MRPREELADPRRILLWDLDGTLADTRRDIAAGVSGMMADRGLPPLPLDAVLHNVGQGVRHLVTRCLEDTGRPARSDSEIDEAVALFRTHYRAHLLDTTVPYGDLAETVRILASRDRKMAVISNKPEDFTRRIVEALGMLSCFAVVLGGDSLASRKPSPEPLLHALRICEAGASPESAILIGDSVTDVRTARAAGSPVCAVAWGYDPERLLPASNPDWWFETPGELSLALLATV